MRAEPQRERGLRDVFVQRLLNGYQRQALFDPESEGFRFDVGVNGASHARVIKTGSCPAGPSAAASSRMAFIALRNVAVVEDVAPVSARGNHRSRAKLQGSSTAVRGKTIGDTPPRPFS
jgi:hypothetical protein